jgi:hypothetical protein
MAPQMLLSDKALPAVAHMAQRRGLSTISGGSDRLYRVSFCLGDPTLISCKCGLATLTYYLTSYRYHCGMSPLWAKQKKR